jgi:Spy/CpxP family protein refolding chaperone
MQRSKQQALMFLLGALLVGGALGFSADRMLSSDDARRRFGRGAMYEELELSARQRAAMDSLIDAADCDRRTAMKPVQPQLDSIKQRARTAMDALLTAEQRTKLESLRAEAEQRHAELAKRHTSRCTQ